MKLKPCPFCGGTDLDVFGRKSIIYAHHYDHTHPDAFSSFPIQAWIKCMDCGAEVSSDLGFWGRPLEREVVEKWNRRVP